MRSVKDAKAWIQWYYEVKDSHGAPALSFIDSTGRLYGKHCTKCRGKNRHARRGGGYACGYCGADWPYVDRFILKGEIQRSLTTSGFEIKNARQFDIGRLIHNLLLSQMIPGHLYVANAMHFSIRKLVESGSEYWPDWEFTWTRHAVHEAVKRGASVWEKSLTEAGIHFSS